METRRWVNHSQPQTMQIAVFLLYFNAFFAGLDFLSGGDALIAFVFGSPHRLILLVLTAAYVGGGYFVANERKSGYALAVAAAVFPLAVRLYAAVVEDVGIVDYELLNLLFDVALVALLLHPQSRDYQRIWFK